MCLVITCFPTILIIKIVIWRKTHYLFNVVILVVPRLEMGKRTIITLLVTDKYCIRSDKQIITKFLFPTCICTLHFLLKAFICW